MKWRSTDDEVDLSDFPYADANSSSFLMGGLALGLAMGGSAGEPSPPLVTTWFFDRDEGVLDRCSTDQIDLLLEVFGGFVQSSGLLAGYWDALEVVTPLGNRSLIMLSEATGAGKANVRLVVPLAFGIRPTKRDRAQIQESIDWLLSKVASPYMRYVPIVETDAQRQAAMETVVARSGTPHPGPLSEVDWLADPNISAVTSNLRGFPGAGSLRVGILDERREARQRAVFRDGRIDLVDLPPGTVDVYAGWQLELDGMGVMGLMALGHRSFLGMIDAVAEVSAIAEEFGGIAPTS